MSLDADPCKLTKHGTVTIRPKRGDVCQIVVEGFEGSGTTCRDVAIQACAWAIGELQREMLRTIEVPGGGSIGIG